MIIPVRCYTCGKVVADLWRHYQKATGDLIVADTEEASRVRSETLGEIGLTRLCCRRMLLSQPPEDILASL